MTVLVTGATGRAGREVVNELVRAGARVRAVTRDPARAGLPEGVEVVHGDLERPATLEPAMDGVSRLYLFPVEESAREVAELAGRRGVERIVVLSGALADQDDLGYAQVEKAVRASGVAWTMIRPGEFAANWLDAAEGIRSRREVRRPYGAALTRPTHEADIGLIAATVLLEDGHAGQVYTFAGPQELTVAEQVAVIGRAIGEEVRFVELTPEQARREWYDPDNGVTHEVIDWLLDLYASALGAGVVAGGDVFQRVTGRPPRSFEQWARDHAADFR
ncbi:NAD(P)H-binding protein [Nonomuraea longicatena]|uniref:NAD(P)H-binding protein n=1 Tax=Nonomuraea longicatena TaxID=83682 RepID=A0ABP3Z3K6_9ACTN